MNKSPELIELCTAIEQWAGKTMSGPNDFDALSMKIWDKTHIQLSSSTLKRIWGYYNDTGKAHRSSLDILSRCLGYTGYTEFLQQLSKKQKPTSEYIANSTIRTEDLAVPSVSLRKTKHSSCFRSSSVFLSFSCSSCFFLSHNRKACCGSLFSCCSQK